MFSLILINPVVLDDVLLAVDSDGFRFGFHVGSCWQLAGRSSTYGVRRGLRGSAESFPDSWPLTVDGSFGAESRLLFHSSKKLCIALFASSSGKRASHWIKSFRVVESLG